MKYHASSLRYWRAACNECEWWQEVDPTDDRDRQRRASVFARQYAREHAYETNHEVEVVRVMGWIEP